MNYKFEMRSDYLTEYVIVKVYEALFIELALVSDTLWMHS
jgi:hypothetical protein